MFRKIDPRETWAAPITITVDGSPVLVQNGEMIAAVLLRTPPFISRTTPVGGQPRAPYCMMGACFDCMVEVDGQPSVRSCLTRAREGMAVRRQQGRPDPMRLVVADRIFEGADPA